MSQKNKLENKRARRMERALRKGRIETKLDLIKWLMDRGYAQTRGAAAKLIHERQVFYESHPLGFRQITVENPVTKEPESKEVYDRYVPSSLRDGIRFVPHKSLESAD